MALWGIPVRRGLHLFRAPCPATGKTNESKRRSRSPRRCRQKQQRACPAHPAFRQSYPAHSISDHNRTRRSASRRRRDAEHPWAFSCFSSVTGLLHGVHFRWLLRCGLLRAGTIRQSGKIERWRRNPPSTTASRPNDRPMEKCGYSSLFCSLSRLGVSHSSCSWRNRFRRE